jgi:hypothetical protein
MTPVTTINKVHHAQRLRHILDAQSDVLDALNAMTKVHIDRNKECIEIIYDLYTDALVFPTVANNLHPLLILNTIPKIVVVRRTEV